MIDAVIDDLILGTPNLINKVGKRVRPIVRDETLPCISYKKDSEIGELDISGFNNGIKQASISVTIYSRDYSQLKTIAQDMKNHLLIQRGMIDNCTIHLVVFDGDDDDFDNESKIYLNESNYTLHFEG